MVSYFYSRPCGRGDRPPQSWRYVEEEFLLTPLREGRLYTGLNDFRQKLISTHAPAGGATRNGFNQAVDERHISTHAPAGGATQERPVTPTNNEQFLLTPLREGRRKAVCHRHVGAVISTHAPAGGATGDQTLGHWHFLHFYSRPCGRGDFKGCQSRRALFYFYSRPCGRGDKAHPNYYGLWSFISTHAPAGGATHGAPRVISDDLFLLTPLREGRREPERGALCRLDAISTHAPAGGATLAQAAKCSVWIISTHAPAGGATGGSTRYICSASISTHAPAGGATHLPHDLRQSALISTHAPAGGATSCSRCCSSTDSHFYSRPCGRGDVDGALDRKNLPNFYSRPCGRGDFPVLFQNQGNPLFLLTPLREGRLPRLRDHLCSDCISTHAPAGGATKQHSCQRLAVNISTHAPAGGATPTIQISAKSALISTHAPAGGATSCSRCCSSTHSHFYSRPCGRGDSNFPQVRHEVLRQIAER